MSIPKNPPPYVGGYATADKVTILAMVLFYACPVLRNDLD